MSRRRGVSMLTLKAWRDTLAHKGQFIALIVLVALGIMSFVTFQNGYYDLQGIARRRPTAAALRRLHRAGRPHAALGGARAVERLPGVDGRARAHRPRRRARARDGGQQATARIISLPGRPASSVNARAHRGGPLPRADARDEVAAPPQVRRGDRHRRQRRLTLRIGGERRVVRVVGIGIDPEYLYPLRSDGDLPVAGRVRRPVRHRARASSTCFGTSDSGNDVAVRADAGHRHRRPGRGRRGRARALRRRDSTAPARRPARLRRRCSPSSTRTA